MPTERCQWCGKKHSYSESYCFAKHQVEHRSRNRPRVKTIGDAYEGGKLRADLVGTDMEAILLKRQQQKAMDAVLGLGENGYRVPRNVHYILDQEFVWTQIASQRPWAVVVFTERGRKRKRFNNLWDSVLFHRKMSRAGLSASIVSMGRGYDLPPQWRFKKDKLARKWKWCPHCVDFRQFTRAIPEVRFEASIKKWNEEKQRYEWKHRLVWVMECKVCGNNNRSSIYRRANQPWEVRRIRKGVTRVKPRPGAPTRRKRKYP